MFDASRMKDFVIKHGKITKAIEMQHPFRNNSSKPSEDLRRSQNFGSQYQFKASSTTRRTKPIQLGLYGGVKNPGADVADDRQKKGVIFIKKKSQNKELISQNTEESRLRSSNLY